MKKMIVIFLALFTIIFGLHGNTIREKGNTRWLELLNDKGDVLFEVYKDYIVGENETDKYFYFLDNKGAVTGTPNTQVFINKKTGNMDYQYHNIFPCCLSADSRYLLAIKHPRKTEKVSYICYNDDINIYYEYNTTYTPFIQPMLLKLETGEEIIINNIDSSFVQKSMGEADLTIIEYDKKNNSFIMYYVCEGGFKAYITSIDLNTMTFHIKRQYVWAQKNCVMYCKDNLKLRESESLSAKTIAIMKKNTIIRVLRQANEELLIENLHSIWVEVEVIEDSLTTDGELLPKGTKGWCYGGYLDNVYDTSLIPKLNGKATAPENEISESIKQIENQPQKKSIFYFISDFFLKLFKKK